MNLRIYKGKNFSFFADHDEETGIDFPNKSQLYKYNYWNFFVMVTKYGIMYKLLVYNEILGFLENRKSVKLTKR